jgi:hypothetical protein
MGTVHWSEPLCSDKLPFAYLALTEFCDSSCRADGTGFAYLRGSVTSNVVLHSQPPVEWITVECP